MFGLSNIRNTLGPVGALAICLSTLLPVAASASDENTIKIELDYARVIKLDRAVSRVIIGNAEIADATVSDSKTIILTGKRFGTTNLVILDVDGTAIVDERVLVSLEAHNTMQVYRQTDRQVMSCTPACEPLDLP
ncbi:pilus assembly protein N-terminal domain-containing protein [Hoeflea sp. TYP-13]|uniref:pilus assembly protein N-terminal domain-containing protein n=1 Tax=Hoeflea sp. TYP-13 TaxID=3230023 RepID=UPI0034C5FBF3